MNPINFMYVFVIPTMVSALYIYEGHVLHNIHYRKRRSVTEPLPETEINGRSIYQGINAGGTEKPKSTLTEEEEATNSINDEDELNKLSTDEVRELLTLEHGLTNDQEHYFRIPGGKCNTTDQLNESLEKLRTRGNYSRLEHHRINRRNCLWYTKTHCMPVPRREASNQSELRCVCIEGRTWEDGACLAFHGQKCLWDNDCVRGANCKLPGDEGYPSQELNETTTTETMLVRRRRSRSRRDTVKDSKDNSDLFTQEVKFELGICVCRMFDECQRTSKYPPYIDEDLGWLVRPSCSLLSMTILINLVYYYAN